LIVRPDQTFEIKINNKIEKKGSLLDNFEPPVNPPKEIDDPNDKKPSDWIDIQKISDPTAQKPNDWDESAPKKILSDESQPDGWLVDEPAQISDPQVQKPEDWDDEEDGDWAAPSIPNPKCTEAPGCGKWQPPMIDNPLYKGKWTAPMIDNPAYKGEWKPQKITNPTYFHDDTPANFQKMGAVGFELWSMQDGFVFDNIYIGFSERDADVLAKETWQVKYDMEKTEDPNEATETFTEKAGKLVAGVKARVELVKKQVGEFVGLARGDFFGCV